MRRRPTILLLAMALVAVALVLGACGGGDDDDATTANPAPSAESPSGDATPPSLGALPPGIAECIADQGFELESPDQLHSVPEQVLQTCFNALHQGGAAP